MKSPVSTIISGWKRSGIHPWVPSNVDMKKLNPSKIFQSDSDDMRGAGQSAPATVAANDNLQVIIKRKLSYSAFIFY